MAETACNTHSASAATLAITPASVVVPAAAGAGATASSLHEFEGSVLKREKRRSVYETREPTWLDRLRRLVGSEESSAPIKLNGQGKPTLVVANGELVGVRDVNGGLVRFPEVPANRPDLWPEEWWVRVGEFRRRGGR